MNGLESYICQFIKTFFFALQGEWITVCISLPLVSNTWNICYIMGENEVPLSCPAYFAV